MLLLLSAYFITQNNTQQSIAPVIADLSIEEMENYIQENIDDFDEETLIEFAVQNDHNNFGEINANEEELENYMNEIIDEIDEEDLEELL